LSLIFILFSLQKPLKAITKTVETGRMGSLGVDMGFTELYLSMKEMNSEKRGGKNSSLENPGPFPLSSLLRSIEHFKATRNLSEEKTAAQGVSFELI
jgi:hypothetical protein